MREEQDVKGIMFLPRDTENMLVIGIAEQAGLDAQYRDKNIFINVWRKMTMYSFSSYLIAPKKKYAAQSSFPE